MQISLFVKLIISLLLGSVIGLEREKGNDKKQEMWTLGGVRTFALLSFLGSISGFLFINKDYVLSNIISSFVLLLILIYYFITAFKANSTGLTTEISALLVYLIGFLIVIDIIPVSVIVAFSIILILILSNKKPSKKLASNITKKEWNSFLSFAIILLVILPFLPNIDYKIKDLMFLKNLPFNTTVQELAIINPYNLWLIIVLISGINLLGYLLRKKFGSNKGIYLCSFFGGFMSSTLTNHLLTERSKKENEENQKNLAIGNILSYTASIISISFFIGILNSELLIKVIPGLVFIILSNFLYILFLKKKKQEKCPIEMDIVKKESPDLLLIPAIKFALLIISIKIIVGLVLILWGSSWFIVASLVSSLTGIDAIIINLSEMAQKTITINYAILVILLINSFNLLGKWAYSWWKGGKRFSFLNFILFIIITISSFIWYLWAI
jgi:uncharacterized membrane protein (DUF4010 family)